MQYNSEANSLDLYSDARWWCGLSTSDTTSYPLVDFTRNSNLALDVVTSKILKSDGTWKWGDFNNTDLSIGYTTLVANQEDYSIAVTHLKYTRVRVMDANGDYHVLDPVNRRDLTDAQLNADAGMPKQYYQVENSIILVPKPASGSVTLTEGLEVEYQRGASYFVYTDTTKVPGFATQFHRLISLYAALDYCHVNDLEKRASKIQKKIEGMEAELILHYSTRDADQEPLLSVQKNDYGELGLM